MLSKHGRDTDDYSTFGGLNSMIEKVAKRQHIERC